jgi:hypothetical protein
LAYQGYTEMSSATWSHHIASLATQLVAGDRNSTEISSLNFLRKNGKTFTYIGAKKKSTNTATMLPKKQKERKEEKVVHPPQACSTMAPGPLPKRQSAQVARDIP